MPDPITEENIAEIRTERRIKREEKQQSLNRQRDYARRVCLKDLDSVIQTVEYVLEITQIPYKKEELKERNPKRQLRTNYLTQLLSLVELRY